MKTIILDNIRIPVEMGIGKGLDNSIISVAKKRFGTADFVYSGIFHKSIDARHRSKINYVVSAKFKIDDSFALNGIKGCKIYAPKEQEQIVPGNIRIVNPPVIAGSGPSGLFCAYLLALNGYEPIVLERGDNIDDRKKKVKKLWTQGELDTESNVQFGEGGAGTFSDGKLVTRINDPRCEFVIDVFLKHRAPSEIAYEAKPHIGTDVLAPMIKGIREEIISLGGKFVFNAKLTDINMGSRLKSVRVNNDYDITTDLLVLAIGHSARDTYEMLHERGVLLEQKPFSAGVRIEHLQYDVNAVQWGNMAKIIKSSAEYSMHTKINNRVAYTFCMCPGGVVVNASSEEGGLNVNGMSYNARNGRNANSAWVTEVWPNDLGSKHPLAGIVFQREIEKRSFLAGGGKFGAPVQKLGDFIDGKITSKFGGVEPSFTGETQFADLNTILPEFISETLKSSLKVFGRKLEFFRNPYALLTGCETRTSAPIRIKRTYEHESVTHKGIYPAGEGAGYAGGIMSAAVDGMKVAESIIKLYNYNR
ncbi:MAG: hypothetical protein J7L77_01550 [Clostridiales bacterium]|nr:hypothetical protein [Clostridiales bacterium]